MHDTFHIDILVILLMVMSAVAATVKWIKVPYSIALVIIGLMCGVLHLFPPVDMTPNLILLVFLPALLFEASWNIDLRQLKENWLPIGLFATVGVIISTAAVALIAHFCGGVDLKIAFLFGAMISATDPISVLALFRKMGLNKRLTMILEGESLFNDGTAVVLFKLILAIVMANTAFSVTATAGSFLVVVLGGAAVGALIGYGASCLTSLFDDHLLEITLTTIVAYGSFLLAEQLQVSPVIAVLSAGIVVGNYGSRTAMSATTRLAVNSFWEYAAFLVNSFVFLLIGLQVKAELLVKYAPLITVGIFAALVSRLVVVYGLAPLAQIRQQKLPIAWRHLLFWGGLRGSISMALALSLPATLPAREGIVIATFGVVLFTLIVQGLTIEPLVRLLKIKPTKDKLSLYQKLKAELIAVKKSADFIEAEHSAGHISKHAHQALSLELSGRQQVLLDQLQEMHLSDSSLNAMETMEIRKTVLELQKDCFTRLAREGIIGDDVCSELTTDTNRQLADVLGAEIEAINAIADGASEDAAEIAAAVATESVNVSDRDRTDNEH